MLSYIKFWLAKELAGFMIFVGIIAAIAILFGALVLYDFLQGKFRRKQ